ncbi:MAG: RNA polymerase sigma factor [Bacteroidetes bacterium]|nr:RNA polymerase sigma factor [Bacteroidota bacterium]
MLVKGSTKTNFNKSNQETPFPVLLEMAKNGDEKAFKAIYDALSGKMYSLCLRYAGNPNDANDYFQDGIIRVYRNLANFKGTGSFEGWARRIFVNTCLDHINKKQKLNFSEINDEISIETNELTGVERLSHTDLFKLIQKLPEGYRTVVNLYLVEEYNHKEISEMLGISEGTSKSQLSRAKTLLQKSIAAHYDR